MFQHVRVDDRAGRDHFGTEIGQCVDCLLECRANVSHYGGVTEVRREADAQTVKPRGVRREDRRLDRQAGGVAYVMPGDDVQEQCRVGDRAGDRSGMGERWP